MRYRYEMWNGKGVVGYYNTNEVLMGASLTLPITKNYQLVNLVVPISHRVVRDNGIDTVIRRVLDVSDLSKQEKRFIRGR